MLSVRNRVRIRFAKQDQMRLLGHRDLIRMFERALRRTGLRLSLSQGFHPKAKLSFPLALATGMEGTEEVMEVELDEPLAADRLAEILRPELPAGIYLGDSVLAPPRPRKARVLRVHYRLPVVESWCARVEQSLASFLARPDEPWWVERAGREKPLNARVGLESVTLREGMLEVIQVALQTAIVGPRELLVSLGLGELENAGVWWTRHRVELAEAEVGSADSAPNRSSFPPRPNPEHSADVSLQGDAYSNPMKESTKI